MKKIDTSPMSPETAAFNRLEGLLELLPAHGLTDTEWASVDRAYGQWCATLPPGDLADPGAPGSARAKVLAAVARHRVERDDDGEVRSRAFDQLKKALDAAPRPRHAKEKDWLPILSAYESWKDTLGPDELHGYRVEQHALRAKVVQGYEASAQALALDALERHRAHYHYMTTERVRRAARSQARAEEVACASVSVAAVVARRYRQAARDLTLNFGRYDRGWGGEALIDETDERVWKAPEAAA